MRPLSTAELLAGWEQGSSAPAYARTFALLAAACPDLSHEAIAQLSVGRRDARLLKLRELTFGAQLLSVANCLSCGERLEWSVNTADLQVDPDNEPCSEMKLDAGPYSIRFRLPTSLDVAALVDTQDPAIGQTLLLERCVLEARLDDKEIGAKELTAEVTNAIARRMGQADPQADIQFDLTCPACGHCWQALLDIESYFWTELSSWAKRVLAEVHVLASAYGWRELDILNLSYFRRQYYLGLVSG
jgi:hypothetical protein